MCSDNPFPSLRYAARNNLLADNSPVGTALQRDIRRGVHCTSAYLPASPRPPTNIGFFRHELKIFSVRAIKNADGAKGIAKFFMLEYNVSTGIMFPKIFDFKEN